MNRAGDHIGKYAFQTPAASDPAKLADEECLARCSRVGANAFLPVSRMIDVGVDRATPLNHELRMPMEPRLYDIIDVLPDPLIVDGAIEVWDRPEGEASRTTKRSFLPSLAQWLHFDRRHAKVSRRTTRLTTHLKVRTMSVTLLSGMER